MAHRIIRLSISPEDAPAVRRVIDFDGRNSLHDVHELMHDTLNIGDDDHLYAFFLSGEYWDKSSEYVDPRTHGARADQALLFRLRLREGQHFVYVYDFGTEHRYSLSVVSVTETEAPLAAPVLIESVGDALPPLDGPDLDDDDNDYDPGEPDRALAKPLELAAAVIEQLEAIDELGEEASDDETRPLLRPLGEATLALLAVIDCNLQLLSAIDRNFHVQLIGLVTDVPGRLSAAGETDLAVRVAEALKFCAPDHMSGEIAIAYARAGDRQRALELVLTNLETAVEPYIAEYHAGYVYRELGEDDAAEAYFRRSLAVAKTKSQRSEAALRITSHLIDTGRETEAAEFVAQQHAALSDSPKSARAQFPAVGRNEPCPCGSGKKYKKCHGA